MKKLLFIWFIILIVSCQDDPKEDEFTFIQESPEQSNDSASKTEKDFDFREYRFLKNRSDSLLQKKDDSENNQNLVVSKSYLKIEEYYLLSFKYPLLNENINSDYSKFNRFMRDTFINIEGTEADLDARKASICDTSRPARYPEIRRIDYKIYNVNDQLISLLFYKENFYSKTPLPVYTFETLNFDLKKAYFLNFDELFISSSENELRKILNEILKEKIDSGELYYDCWEISEEDFHEYRNNFVLKDGLIEYYFDDCIICPSYTGIFSISIPIEKIQSLLIEQNTEQISS